jgi:hypothetical protein
MISNIIMKGGFMKSSRIFTAIIVLVTVLVALLGCTGEPTTPETTMPPPESGIESPPTPEYPEGEPQYTADLTGSGTASASTEGIGGPPSAVFDNNDSTYWQVSESDDEWLGYDFGKGNSCIIGKYSITTHSSPGDMPSSFTLQGSGDGVSWTALDTRTGVPPARSVSYTFDNTCLYRYYRLANIHRQPNMAPFIIQDMELCSLVSTPEVSCPPSISCAEPSPPPDEDLIWSEAAGKDIRIEDGTWIWRGFHYEWENNNHKFHDIKCEYYDIKYDFDPASGKSKLSGKLTGQQNYRELATCEDKLNYYTIKRGIKTGVAEFRHGTMDEVRVSGDVGEHVEMVFPQHIDLDGLEKYDNVTVIMRGFSFEEIGSQTKAGAGAYPVQCFGLWVSDITGPYDKGYEPGQYLRCNLHVVLHVNGEPFNIFPKPDPWEYSVRYYYTLVGGNDGEFNYTLGDKYYRGEFVSRGNKVDCPRAPDKVRETTITGATCYDSGVVAFRGFRITINHDTSNLHPKGEVVWYPERNLGRNIRTLDVAITWQGYSKKTGRATFHPDIYLCNKAANQNAMNTEYEGYFTLLQFRDPNQWDDTLELNDAGMGKSQWVVPDAALSCCPFYRKSLESVSFPTP